MAIIAVAGGLYFLFGSGGVKAALFPLIVSIGVMSIIAGALLWLRVPAAKWLGVLTFAAIIFMGVRHGWVKGWTGVVLNVLFPLACMFLMARIDYSHRSESDDD